MSAKFPEPPAPARLVAIPPVERVMRTGARFWRIYFQSGPYPASWNALRGYGPTNARFDHQLPPPRVQARQVLYAAEDALTCLAEVFQDTRTIDRGRNNPWLVCFEMTRPIRLLDLTGAWPTRAGASMALNSGPRPRARRWSQAIYEAYPAIEGLYYASSMNANKPALMLYERAGPALPGRPLFHRALVDATLTAAVIRGAGHFNYVVT